ncbi:MAG: penicillin acylase family protein [Anaerolineae bacterium]|nr:penicillin acylase family protein [Anaerolineae bacterium]
MRILRIVLLVLVILIAVLAVGGAVIFNRWTRGPLPQTAGTITVTGGTVGTQAFAGLENEVRVIRDNLGIPHIYASSPHDLFFAQGYTQAQDRWWQMEFSRHIGSGRIQELTGKNDDVMGQDVFIRTVGWRRAAEQDYASYDEEGKAILQAFSDGVNAYILNRAPGELAFEYNILGTFRSINIPIEAWTPIDSLVWAKVMAWNLSGNRSAELLRSEMIAELGEEMTAIFMPDYPFDDKPTIVKAEELPIGDSSLSNPADTAGIVGINTTLAGGITVTAPLFRENHSIGSNNWVISGELTQSGMPLLANDPHLGIQMPSIWYEIGLHCNTVDDACPYNVTGFALPATPGVVIGHNDHIAWGMTNVGPDTQDLYLMKINPENPLQYEWNGEWRDMTVYEEVIRLGGKTDTVTIQVRQTHLGPIINDNQINEETGEIGGFNNQDPMAFHWTATVEPGTILKAVSLLNRATNWEEFRVAASFFDVPAQNLIYADVEGNIGYQTPGRIPVRAEGHTGLLPVDGSTDQYEWLGYIPFDELPRVLNPEKGYIATANEAVVPPEYYAQLSEKLADEFSANANYTISYEWAYGYRAQRIEEMIENNGPHTLETIQAIQGDNKIISAEELAPYLQTLDFGDTKYNDARDWMLNWDYQMSMTSPQGAFYAYFWWRLGQNLFEDQLGEIIGPDEGDQGMWSTYLLMEQPENVWWDDVNTADKTETRDEIIIRSLQEAYDMAVKDLGDNRDTWAWGKQHTATFVSNPLGASGIDLIENIVNRGPAETGGGGDLVNATAWDYDNSGFTVRSLPSMRMIVDFSDLSRSLSIHTTGQSGHPYSPHYGDMIDLWRNIQYHPMLWTPEQVSAAQSAILTLSPG